jgi:hypothetical protein
MVSIICFRIRLHVQERCADALHQHGECGCEVCQYVRGWVLTFHL